MKTRSQKIHELESRKKLDKKNNYDELVVELKKIVSELKTLLGVELTVDTSQLVKELQQISTYSDSIKTLDETINKFEIKIPELPKSIELSGQEDLVLAIKELKDANESMPSDITINNVDEVLKVVDALNKIKVPTELSIANVSDIKDSIQEAVEEGVKRIKVPETKVSFIDSPDVSLFIESVNGLKAGLVDNIKSLTTALTNIVGKLSADVYKGNQNATDYIPVRRVKKVGNNLVYDDDDWTSRGGSGSAPLPTVLVDGNNVVLVSDPSQRPTNKYKYCAESTTSTYEFAFYEDKDGNWYVQRETIASGYLSFTKGTGGVGSVYTNSTSAPSGSLTYGTYAETFA